MTPTALHKSAGISIPYASQILSGKRVPPHPLAIHIYRKTGWRHATIAEMSDDQIAALESIDQWQPVAERGQAA